MRGKAIAAGLALIRGGLLFKPKRIECGQVFGLCFF